LPRIALSASGVRAAPATMVIVQLAGALYLGFAALDWMARGNMIGGIYARPVTIGNLLHFVSGTAVIVKALSRDPMPAALWMLSAVYVVLAVAFSALLWRSPARRP
jgi:hypothetical protein